LFAEIKSLLLKYNVLFPNDQDFMRREHVGFAALPTPHISAHRSGRWV
jgi:hypothetical protein